MIYCFDIDGTICTQNGDGMNYADAQPIPDTIGRINRLHDKRNKIILHTARGSETGIDWRQLTEMQLKGWGVRYDELYFGKPAADYYVDDKAVNIKDFEAEL